MKKGTLCQVTEAGYYPLVQIVRCNFVNLKSWEVIRRLNDAKQALIERGGYILQNKVAKIDDSLVKQSLSTEKL
jgi:hypothetical protein